MLHFDALILGGCKFYCLRTKGCEDIAKLKGFRKSKGEELAFEDFEMMANKGVKTPRLMKTVKPLNFSICPKRLLISCFSCRDQIQKNYHSTLLRPAVPCLNFVPRKVHFGVFAK